MAPEKQNTIAGKADRVRHIRTADLRIAGQKTNGKCTYQGS